MTSRSRDFGTSTILMVLAIAMIALVNECLGCMTAPAQEQVAAGSLAAGAPATTDEMLQQMAQQAGAIFAGQVLAVRRPAGYAGSGQSAAEAVVEIDFRVDEPVLGPSQGTVYTLREWAGLWAGSTERYRLGQRLLLFLRSPNAQGLSAPVHGLDGAIPLRGGGIAPGPDTATAAAAERLVDLRWLRAQTLRQPVATREPGWPVHGPPHAPISEQASSRIPEAIAARAEVGTAPVTDFAAATLPTPWLMEPPAFQSTNAAAEPLAQVLSLCRNQMKVSDAAH
jgi:hypothetical protein